MTKLSKFFRRLFRVGSRDESDKPGSRRLTTEEQLRALDKLIAHIKEKAKENGFDLDEEDEDEEEQQ